MLVNLSPRNNYLSKREQHRKSWKHYDSGLTRKEKNEYGTNDFSTKFESLFTPTEFTGVYSSDFDAGVINCWCKQFAPYGYKFFRKLKRQFSSISEKLKFEKNHSYYGVADNLEQVIDFYNTNEDGFFKGNHVISTFEVHKDVEAPYCGWRWHKWGPYIGTQEPRCEYLNNEPEIEKVICFHIYKVN